MKTITWEALILRIKQMVFNGESEAGRRFYSNLLKLLDSPLRQKFDNPDQLVRASGIKSDQTVLEIGCGSGFFSIAAAKMVGSKGKVYATDIHPMAIAETRTKIHQTGLENVIVEKDDAMNSAFADATFDLVLLYGVVPAPVIALPELTKEIYRLLKPNGVCAIWTKMPFWTPASLLQYAAFEKMSNNNGVFRLRKK
jgi:demethylmenaquinone methyltransferase/2-methoxy-6-polyprenyl-1,4-benzoquinol methylase